MRLARPATAIAIAALAIAGCASAEPGWTYAPPPSATPVPSLEPSAVPSAAASAGASAAPSAAVSAAPSAAVSAAPSGAVGGDVVQVSAVNVLFDQKTLTVPAAVPFKIEFANNDPTVPHDVVIKDGAGATLFAGATFPGVETRTYDAPALPAGPFQFICSVHPTVMIIEVTAE